MQSLDGTLRQLREQRDAAVAMSDAAVAEIHAAMSELWFALDQIQARDAALAREQQQNEQLAAALAAAREEIMALRVRMMRSD